MKLHLPKALSAVIIAALMNCAYVTSAKTYQGVTFEVDNNVVAGANAGNTTVTVGSGDYSSYNMYVKAQNGSIGAAAHVLSNDKPNTLIGQSDGGGNTIYSSTTIIVGSLDDTDTTAPTNIDTILGSSYCDNSVVGDKNITINSGNVGLVIGSTSYVNMNSSNLSHVNNTIGDKYYAYKDSSNPADVNITINGGTVGQIRGGNNSKHEDYVIKVCEAAKKADKDNGTNTYDALMTDKPWSVSGDVNITLNDGTVGKGAGTKAIMGAGGSGHSVDGAVNITIGGNSTVNGNVYAGSSNIYSEVGSTSVVIQDAAVVNGDVYAGGYIDDGRAESRNNGQDGYGILYPSAPSPTIEEDAVVVLKGGSVENVYGAGDGDCVGGSTEITITGKGTAVRGKIFGGGINKSTVTGDRKLEVDSTHKGTQDYKLADFKNIDVAGDLSLTELTVATDDDGTSVNVQKDGSIKTKAGVLTNLNKLNVDGTLNIDMNGTDSTKSAVSGKILTLGDNAVINVQLDGAEAAESIALFGFDDIQDDADDLIITLNGKLVDDALWDFTGGNLVIQEASTTTLNLSRNQSSFYQAVQAAAAANPDNQMLVDLATARDEAAVKAAIDAMSGHEYATAMSSQIEGNLGHLRRLHGAMGKGEMLGKVTDAKMGTTTVSPWRAGVSVFHEETEIDSDARGDGYDRSETGAMLNVEYLTKDDVTLGGAISYGRTKLSTDGAKSRHEDNTRFDVYALYGQKRWSFATSLGLGMHEHELLGGDVDGYSINFLQDAAYTVLSREKDNVQVFGTIESSWNEIDSCSNGVVSADSQDAWATDVTAGVRYNRVLRAFGNAPAGVFTAQTGVTASIGDIKSGVDMSLGGYGYRQESATRNRWGWNLGAGVDVPVRTNVSIYGTAEAVLRGDSNSVDGQVGVKVSF